MAWNSWNEYLHTGIKIKKNKIEGMDRYYRCISKGKRHNEIALAHQNMHTRIKPISLARIEMMNYLKITNGK